MEVIKMKNEEMKQLLKNENIYMWQIAQVLKIHETTFGKWFRTPLTQDQQRQILSAIETIKLTRDKTN